MTSVIEDLSDDECALIAILSDTSGIDIAEFALYDGEREGPWRAWSFQVPWFRDMAPLQVDQAGRSLGKSTSIWLRMLAFPFNYPDQEAVITAPELVHLEPVTKLVETKLQDTRLAREMLPKSRSAITHRPFHMQFVNGARIMGRIPQITGRGVKGLHPIVLEMDEAQDYPPDGWTEIIETLKRGSERSIWRVHGVTRGMRDKFYDITQPSPNNEWSVHRITAMSRPTWTDQERQEKIKLYSSKDHPDYRRNILGLHGDQANPLFVLPRLMACVEDDLSDPYNTSEYAYQRITHESLKDEGGDIVSMLEIPTKHRELYKSAWAGMDVGMTNHPTEILVFGETRKFRGKESTETVLKLLARLHLERISSPDQARVVVALFGLYNLQGFSMDKTGLGLPLFQDLQEHNPTIAAKIKGYGFSEKILVDFDEGKLAELDEEDDDVKEAGIFKNVLEVSTDYLRDLVDSKRLQLPWDTEVIAQASGQTWSYDKSQMDLYGRRRKVYSQGSFHALDAARMAVLGYRQAKIEEMMRLRNQDTFEPVMDMFVSV